MGSRHPNVSNVDEIAWEEGLSHGSRFASRRKALAAQTGGRSIGCTLYEVAPGKRAFPMHAHLANEEAIFILEGEATMRIGDRQVPVRAGDYVSFLPGQEHAHQLVNTSVAPVRYMCMSTMRAPEVAFYTDSKKVGVRALKPEPLRLLFKRTDAAGGTVADYFDGEESD
jgi:uncharacterized cupin superfamily protein